MREIVVKAREDFRSWLRGPTSYLAAVARHELPVGETLRLHGHEIEAVPDGFRVDGEASGPRTIEAGRYVLRLSHQNMPAVVVLDADVRRAAVTPDWFPYDPAYRFVVSLAPDAADIAIGSTRDRERAAVRAGWLHFVVGGVSCRVMVLRLKEPGVAQDALEVYFTDATSDRESYRMRYLEVAADGDGRSCWTSTVRITLRARTPRTTTARSRRLRTTSPSRSAQASVCPAVFRRGLAQPAPTTAESSERIRSRWRINETRDPRHRASLRSITARKRNAEPSLSAYLLA